MNFLFSKEQNSKFKLYKDHIKLGFEVEGLHITSCLEHKFDNQATSIKYWNDSISLIVDEFHKYFDTMSFPDHIERMLITHGISIIRKIIEQHLIRNTSLEQCRYYSILEICQRELTSDSQFNKLLELLNNQEFGGDITLEPFLINKDQNLTKPLRIKLKSCSIDIDHIELDATMPHLEYILNEFTTNRNVTKIEQVRIFGIIVKDFYSLSRQTSSVDLELVQNQLQAFLSDIYVNFNERKFKGLDSEDSITQYNLTNFIKKNEQIFLNLICNTNINSRGDIRELLYHCDLKLQKKIRGKYNLYKELQTEFHNKFGYGTLYSTVYNGTESKPEWESKVRFEPDFSIAGIGTPVEIITPPLPYTEQMVCLSKIFTFMKDNDIITNDSCGFHVNVSIDGFNQTDIDYNVLFYLYQDENFRRKFRGNPSDWGYINSLNQQEPLFNKNTIKYAWNSIRKLPKTNRQILSKLEVQIDRANSSILDKSIYIKHNCIHNHKTYLEFRTIGNKYNNLKMLSKYIDIIVKSVLFALLKPQSLKIKQKQRVFKYIFSD